MILPMIFDVMVDILEAAEEDREMIARAIVGMSLILYGVFSVRPFVEEHVEQRIADLSSQMDASDEEFKDVSVFDKFRRVIDMLEAAGK